MTLVDTGLSSAPKRILAALAGIGSDASDVTRILLTHGHSDHAGGAAELTGTTRRPWRCIPTTRVGATGTPPRLDPHPSAAGC